MPDNPLPLILGTAGIGLLLYGIQQKRALESAPGTGTEAGGRHVNTGVDQGERDAVEDSMEQEVALGVPARLAPETSEPNILVNKSSDGRRLLVSASWIVKNTGPVPGVAYMEIALLTPALLVATLPGQNQFHTAVDPTKVFSVTNVRSIAASGGSIAPTQGVGGSVSLALDVVPFGDIAVVIRLRQVLDIDGATPEKVGPVFAEFTDFSGVRVVPTTARRA